MFAKGGSHDVNIASIDATAGFTTYTYDKVLDKYFAQYRMYDAEVRRFTAEDPIKDGNNWYNYVGNRPLVMIDPWGLANREIRVGQEKYTHIEDLLNSYGIDYVKSGTDKSPSIRATAKSNNGSAVVFSISLANDIHPSNTFRATMETNGRIVRDINFKNNTTVRGLSDVYVSTNYFESLLCGFDVFVKNHYKTYTTKEGAVIHYYAFDPLTADWSYRLAGTRITFVDNLATYQTTFAINGGYFAGSIPVSLGVNYFNGQSINVNANTDEVLNFNRGDANEQGDYEKMKVLFYNEDGSYTIVNYRDVIDRDGQWQSGYEQKAKDAKFVITGNDGNVEDATARRTAIGITADGTVIIMGVGDSVHDGSYDEQNGLPAAKSV